MWVFLVGGGGGADHAARCKTCVSSCELAGSLLGGTIAYVPAPERRRHAEESSSYEQQTNHRSAAECEGEKTAKLYRLAPSRVTKHLIRIESFKQRCDTGLLTIKNRNVCTQPQINPALSARASHLEPQRPLVKSSRSFSIC